MTQRIKLTVLAFHPTLPIVEITSTLWLWLTSFAIENCCLWWVFSLKKVIFHSYVTNPLMKSHKKKTPSTTNINQITIDPEYRNIIQYLLNGWSPSKNLGICWELERHVAGCISHHLPFWIDILTTYYITMIPPLKLHIWETHSFSPPYGWTDPIDYGWYLDDMPV